MAFMQAGGHFSEQKIIHYAKNIPGIFTIFLPTAKPVLTYISPNGHLLGI